MENKKIDILQKKLQSLNPYVIAYSGGNDSTFLAAISKHFFNGFLPYSLYKRIYNYR